MILLKNIIKTYLLKKHKFIEKTQKTLIVKDILKSLKISMLYLNFVFHVSKFK